MIMVSMERINKMLLILPKKMQKRYLVVINIVFVLNISIFLKKKRD